MPNGEQQTTEQQLPDELLDVHAICDERDRLRAELARMIEIADALLNHCDKESGECSVCSVIVCPNKDPLHFHHDGCPSCSFPGDVDAR